MVKAEMGAFLNEGCETIRALELLDTVLKKADNGFLSVRSIRPVRGELGTDFFIECTIISSHKYPYLKQELDSLFDEEMKRKRIKEGIESTKTQSSYWNDLTDEQVHTLYYYTISLKKEYDADRDIVLKGDMEITSNITGREVDSFIRAFAETIHEKFPLYDVSAGSGGISLGPGKGILELSN